MNSHTTKICESFLYLKKYYVISTQKTGNGGKTRPKKRWQRKLHVHQKKKEKQAVTHKEKKKSKGEVKKLLEKVASALAGNGFGVIFLIAWGRPTKCGQLQIRKKKRKRLVIELVGGAGVYGFHLSHAVAHLPLLSRFQMRREFRMCAMHVLWFLWQHGVADLAGVKSGKRATAKKEKKTHI